MAKTFIWKKSQPKNNKVLELVVMILGFIFEHVSILKQLPHFSSFRVFKIYPGFVAINRIRFNVNFQAFTVYTLARSYHKIKILTKRKIKTNCSFFYNLEINNIEKSKY